MAQPWENLGGNPPPLISPGPAPGTTGDNRQPRIPRYPGTTPAWMQGYRDAMTAWRAQRPDRPEGGFNPNDPAFAAWQAGRPEQPQKPAHGSPGADPARPLVDPSDHVKFNSGGGNWQGGNFGSNLGNAGGGIFNSPAFGRVTWGGGVGGGRGTGGIPTVPGTPAPGTDPTLVDYYDPLRRRSRFGSLGGSSFSGSSGKKFKGGKSGGKGSGKSSTGTGADEAYNLVRPGLGVDPTKGTPMPGFKFPNYSQQWALDPDIFGKTY